MDVFPACVVSSKLEVVMKISTLIKRGLGIAKTGKALYDLRSGDEEQKKRAKHYLMILLGEGRGLPAKVGQLMTMDGEDHELRETLNASIPPMPFDQVKSILRETYKEPYDAVFHSLEKKGISASLGQVHFGKLKDGREVAVKIQYPEIADAVETELKLFGFLPKVGPVARWGFNLGGYRDVFWDKFSEELDYQREIGYQQRYRQLAAPLRDVVVPQVISEWCRPTVLVQLREEGKTLDTVEKMPQTQRQAAGRALLRHYLYMIFHHGFVHSDPHPGNFAFRFPREGGAVLIIYDFGSVLEIPKKVRLALLRTILALRQREALDPAACLAGLGFDIDKLQDLRPTLPALLQVLFDPFTTDAPYDVKDWRMGERFDGIVGDLKWWFRSAAPPALIYLMRTLHGLVSMLGRLEARLPWSFIMDGLCGDAYPEARILRLPDVPAAAGSAPGFDRMARVMKVHVKKPGGTEVRLTMPARVADDLDGVIDPPVKESIARQGLDLAGMQERVRKSGFVAQTIFELEDSERKVRVWLE